jgi:hypothetical protein
VKLAELQRFFAEAATTGSGPRAGLDSVFVGDSRLSASARLGIYNRAYYFRLLDALASVFTQTERVLGRSEFERLGLAYLAQHPSQHPAVEQVGRLFAEYLRAEAPAAAPIADLAALEWARLGALLAPNPAAVLAASAIVPESFPVARIRFVPALRWLSLDSRALEAFAQGSFTHSTSDAPEARSPVAVWRPQHSVLHERLEPLQLTALELAANGATIERICCCFASGNEAEDIAHAHSMLSGWLSRQWIECLETPNDAA